MLKSLLFVAALALPVLPVAAQQAPQQNAAQGKTTAATYAEGMQTAVGQKFEGDLAIQAITAEANTLVIAIDGPKGWRASMSPESISEALVQGFCSSAPQFFAGGVTMRVDSIDDGKLLKGPLVNACPPAKPE